MLESESAQESETEREVLNDVARIIGLLANTMDEELVRTRLIISKLDKEVTKSIPTLCITDRGRLFINPDFWMKLSDVQKVLLLKHEADHALFRDHSYYRMLAKEIGPKTASLYNLVADACINSGIISKYKKAYHEFTALNPITIEKLHLIINELEKSLGINPTPLEELKRASKDNIFTYLLKLASMLPTTGGGGGEPEKAKKKSKDVDKSAGKIGDAIKEQLGEDPTQDDISVEEEKEEGGKNIEDIAREAEDEAEKAKILRKFIEKAVKKAGIGAGQAREEVKKALPSSYDWRKLLRNLITMGVGGLRRPTWSKESRRLPGLRPGIEKLKKPKIIVLLDVSGSMAPWISQMLGEIRNISQHASEVILVGWDDGIRWVKEFRPYDKIDVEFTGGGTSIVNTIADLNKMRFRINRDDIVILLSDGYFFDSNNDARQALSKLRMQAKIAIFATPTEKDHVDKFLPETWIYVKLAAPPAEAS